jgi:hypothetical protein
MSNLFSVTDKLLKHNPVDGGVVNSYLPSDVDQVNGIELNGSDGNIFVEIYDGSSHGLRYVSQETLSEQWALTLSGFRRPDIFDNGDLMAYDGSATVERRDTADGSVIATYDTEVSVTSGRKVDPASDGGWFVSGGTSGNDKVAKFDSTGTEVWAVEHPAGKRITGLTAGPNGGAIIGADESVVRLDSTGSVLWNTTLDFIETDLLKIDDSGHVMSADGSRGDTHQLALSDGTLIFAGDEPDGDRIGEVGVEKQSESYSAANTGLTRYDDTGSVVYQVQSSTEFRYVERFPNYSTHPGSWETTVTKSAAGTKVASSGTMNTADGTTVDTATASMTASATTMQTASPTTSTASNASVVTSGSTMQTSSPTTATALNATLVASTATMRTVDTAVPAVATTVAGSSSMQTVSAIRRDVASATAVSSDGTMQTPSAVATYRTPESDFNYVGGADGLYKLNADGTIQWSVTSHTAHDPVTDVGGNVYVQGSDETLYAYDDTGTQLWSNAYDNAINFHVGADTLYLTKETGSPGGFIVKRLDPATGDVVWRDELSNNYKITSVTLDGAENAYVGFDSTRVFRYDRADGTRAWYRDFATNFSGDVTHVGGGDVYLYVHLPGGDGPKIKQLDVRDGSTAATQAVGYNDIDQLEIDENANLYLTYDDGTDQIHERYDFSAGVMDYSTALGTDGGLNVTAEGNLYTTYYNGSEYVVQRRDRGDGSLIESFGSFTFSPAFAIYPAYASNQNTWASTTKASLMVGHMRSTTTMASPTSTGSASASGSPVAADGRTVVADATGTAFTAATLTASTASPGAPSSVGAASASSTTVAGSTTMFTVTTSATGSAIVSAASTAVGASASTFTPSGRTFTTSEATMAGAEAVPATPPPVSTAVSAVAGSYDATSTMADATLSILAEAFATKHGTTAAMHTGVEFERQIRTLGRGANSGPIGPSRNESSLRDSRNDS